MFVYLWINGFNLLDQASCLVHDAKGARPSSPVEWPVNASKGSMNPAASTGSPTVLGAPCILAVGTWVFGCIFSSKCPRRD